MENNQKNEVKHPHLKIKICVSGAAETGHCGIDALEVGKTLGREIAAQGAVLTTGATTGFPLWAAMGAKEEGGISIGVSPANSEKEHVEKYALPLEYMDLIMYTGQGYPGRDILLTRTSDAIIIGCGRIGTLHEFTVAFEDDKPIGVLEGDWETDEIIKKIIEEGHRGNGKIIYESDPKKLVEKILKAVDEEKIKTHKCSGCI
ncbi:TPA: hypothetical protein DEW47_01795 [Patescibacteria group bacterium]|nr:MAG: hypothetical protein UT71_C0022G0011 [Parcubacteria group bacterium GW2011_GWF2_40_10]KKR47468.1 MAG: hypothetical protein UT83_C0009G0034 [Parcubacteria group bacterium GW2011_GWA2_40_143]KKR58971.1 MAG: hypothetical protein UT97_C0019G0011 [Parcubacteria group bacterium GW2011_GWC2_40_31]KKR76005.1 MAG: hypothetical protein UU20_C0036G0006 [Parcubacteria group bacterium GW2011_GWE2_40_8]KKR82200.1 MAG: hypothetical protein UU28_C0013G0011 [Parcubacteria group bacterium GW2011_GWD2_40_